MTGLLNLRPRSRLHPWEAKTVICKSKRLKLWQETVAPKPTDDKVLSILQKGFWNYASADWSSKSRSAAALARTLLNLDHERFPPVFYELLACLASASQHNPVVPQKAFWKCAILEVLCVSAKEFVTPFSTDLLVPKQPATQT